MDHLITTITGGIIGGIVSLVLIYWWYIKSGRFNLYLDGVLTKTRATTQARDFPTQKTIGTYDHIPTEILSGVCDRLLGNYKEIELSTITHNRDQTNQYTCILLVGRRIRQNHKKESQRRAF